MEESGRGAAVEQLTARGMDYQSPQWGAIDQDYVGRFHYNRKRQLCQARPHLTCTNRTSLKERTCLISNS